MGHKWAITWFSKQNNEKYLQGGRKKLRNQLIVCGFGIRLWTLLSGPGNHYIINNQDDENPGSNRRYFTGHHEAGACSQLC